MSTGYGLDCWDSIPAIGKSFSHSTAQVLWLKDPPIKRVPGGSGEAAHLPASCAEVNNGGAISPLLHTLSLLNA
jgi:hypothetical protein